MREYESASLKYTQQNTGTRSAEVIFLDDSRGLVVTVHRSLRVTVLTRK